MDTHVLTKRVYWIEDELYLLQRTVNKFHRLGADVIELSNATEVLNNLERIKESPGPIILDLFLPRGSDPNVPTVKEKRSEVGMWVLSKLRHELDYRWPVFVLSGNLDVDIVVQLSSTYGLPSERIFFKPLLDSADQFVDEVLKAEGSESG